jgi:DNA-directed RNA polymerase specialized sigma24 family protein
MAFRTRGDYDEPSHRTTAHGTMAGRVGSSMTTTSGLTREAFDRLLRLFHEDRQQAGEEYERLRLVLIHFFQWRRCADVEELADEVLNRVALQLIRDTEVHSHRAFVYGVARNVYLEVRHRSQGQFVSLDHVPMLVDRINDPASVLDRETTERELERRLLLMSQCLRALTAEHRALFLNYHDGDDSVRTERRKRLASERGISMTALRTRICRIAKDLADCVERRLDRAPRRGHESTER